MFAGFCIFMVNKSGMEMMLRIGKNHWNDKGTDYDPERRRGIYRDLSVMHLRMGTVKMYFFSKR
jgi:hypothetical protein